MRLLDRRLLTAFAITAAALLAACGPSGGAVTTDDMSMGKADAPVTMIEYASASCPHCARFNNNVFPAFKAKYIDTGKVHYVFREFLTPPVDVAAAGFLLARCAGKDKYFTVLDAIFKSQGEMFQDGTPANVRPVMLRIAQSVNINPTQFDACVSNTDALNKLNERIGKYAENEKITSTPTFVVGQNRVEGEVTLEQLDDLVAGKKPAQ
jgi:protein-disulfide isomerase